MPELYDNAANLDSLYARSAVHDSLYDDSIYARDADAEDLYRSLLTARAASAYAYFDGDFDLYVCTEPAKGKEKLLRPTPEEASQLISSGTISRGRRPEGVPESGAKGSTTTFPERGLEPNRGPAVIPESAVQDRYNEQKEQPGAKRWRKGVKCA